MLAVAVDSPPLMLADAVRPRVVLDCSVAFLAGVGPRVVLDGTVPYLARVSCFEIALRRGLSRDELVRRVGAVFFRDFAGDVIRNGTVGEL